jgi:signal transduction histidine kinase
VRIGPNDAWSAPTRDRSVRFVDLAAGHYDVEVAASIDNQHWTTMPAKISFRVLRPWYLQLWFGATLLGLAAVVAYVAYRIRIAGLLLLERQRTQIAMDLHDEIGSGLGSIGIMAGVGLRGDQSRGGQALEHIAATTKDLSAALGDIVWSLRPGTANLAALSAQIESRARPLFAAGARFDTAFPESWPDVALTLPVQRNVLLIALEALHNVARHANAATVTLSIQPLGDLWRLSVYDDGRGLSQTPDAGGRRGLGLEAMRSRAAAIGAAIEWDSPPAGGTRLRLDFHPQGKRG